MNVLSVFFLRFLVKKAKESKPEKIELDFRNNSKQILKVNLTITFKQWFRNNFQLYFDMLYCVNNSDLGINDILQLMEFTLGEGKLKISNIFFIFINILNKYKVILDQIIHGIRKCWRIWLPDSRF